MFTFSEKWKIVRIFQLWCDKKDIPKTPYNFLQFLTAKEFLNLTKIREYLDIFKMEELL